MKKSYSKPVIAVESFHLDAAVAGTCTGENYLTLPHDIYGCNYGPFFAEGVSGCQVAALPANLIIDPNTPYVMGADLTDTMCYHAALGKQVMLTS